MKKFLLLVLVALLALSLPVTALAVGIELSPTTMNLKVGQ